MKMAGELAVSRKKYWRKHGNMLNKYGFTLFKLFMYMYLYITVLHFLSL